MVYNIIIASVLLSSKGFLSMSVQTQNTCSDWSEIFVKKRAKTISWKLSIDRKQQSTISHSALHMDQHIGTCSKYHHGVIQSTAPQNGFINSISHHMSNMITIKIMSYTDNDFQEWCQSEAYLWLFSLSAYFDMDSWIRTENIFIESSGKFLKTNN